MDTNYKKITVTLDLFTYGMPLEDFETRLKKAKERAKLEGIDTLFLDIDYDKGYYDSVEMKVTLTGKRLETKEEHELRVENEAIERERDKAWKLRQYEQLKKEFGDA